jgi:hypothetical protein
MIAEDEKTHDRCTCTVEVSPNEVDAGAELTVTVRVGVPEGRDPAGLTVAIRAQDGAELARAGLVEPDDEEDDEDEDEDRESEEAEEDEAIAETYVTDAIVLTAPLTVGKHVYKAVLLREGEDGSAREEATREFSFLVKAHAARMNVWDVPVTVVAGEAFAFKVGIKCTSGCKLTGRALTIIDHEGAEVGAGKLLEDVWPGTEALYFAEAQATAPPAAGDYKWEVRTPGSDTGIPHEAGAIPLAIRVVPAPDCEVTIEVFDKEKQTPIKGANVVMHPYRAQTDANGVAKIKVAKGDYDIVVSGRQYIPARTTLGVSADMTTRAELDAEPPEPTPDEFYY